MLVLLSARPGLLERRRLNTTGSDLYCLPASPRKTPPGADAGIHGRRSSSSGSQPGQNTGRAGSSAASAREDRDRHGPAINSFDSFLEAIFGRRLYGSTIDEKEAAAFFGALGEGRARVALAMDQASPDEPPTRTQTFLQKLRDRYVGYVPIDATPLLKTLRMVKTPYELRMLTTATDISADAQLAGMRAAVPGAYEYQVKAAIEAVHRGRGAASWAYPSIVGSGPNATILHYPESDRQMLAGELLLVDAAATTVPRPRITHYRWRHVLTGQAAHLRVVLHAREAIKVRARRDADDDSQQDGGVLKEGLMSSASSPIHQASSTMYAQRHISSGSMCMISNHNNQLRQDDVPQGCIRQASRPATETPANLELISKIRQRSPYDIGVRIETRSSWRTASKPVCSTAQGIKDIGAVMHETMRCRRTILTIAARPCPASTSHLAAAAASSSGGTASVQPRALWKASGPRGHHLSRRFFTCSPAVPASPCLRPGPSQSTCWSKSSTVYWRLNRRCSCSAA